MDSVTIISIIIFGGIIVGGIIYFIKFMSSSSNSTISGGKRYIKYKDSNRFYTPTTLNLVLALVFAYIVYSNFVKN
jgi:H+/Cl- antiporter ClcA